MNNAIKGMPVFLPDISHIIFKNINQANSRNGDAMNMVILVIFKRCSVSTKDLRSVTMMICPQMA